VTVSTSIGREWTVNKIVDRAYKFAGLVEVSSNANSAQLRGGRALLEDILDSLPTVSNQARATTFDEVTITAAQVTAETYKFDLGANTLDILDPCMYIPASETDTDRASGETIMRQISQVEWHQYGAKDATGNPTRFYAHREGNTVQAWVWPIPDEAGTMRFRVTRKLADVDDGNATVDLQTYWMDFLKKRLAADLAQASSLSIQKVSYLEMQAHRALNAARGMANERPGFQMYTSHKGPYG